MYNFIREYGLILAVIGIIAAPLLIWLKYKLDVAFPDDDDYKRPYYKKQDNTDYWIKEYHKRKNQYKYKL